MGYVFAIICSHPQKTLKFSNTVGQRKFKDWHNTCQVRSNSTTLNEVAQKCNLGDLSLKAGKVKNSKKIKKNVYYKQDYLQRVIMSAIILLLTRQNTHGSVATLLRISQQTMSCQPLNGRVCCSCKTMNIPQQVMFISELKSWENRDNNSCMSAWTTDMSFPVENYEY